MNGAMVPELLGRPVADIRVTDGRGIAIPFQVDEKTPSGEYICPDGRLPNADSGNGVLDKQDEIVFLREDADSGAAPVMGDGAEGTGEARASVEIRRGGETRHVLISDGRSTPLSPVRYLDYRHDQELLRTPYYYAQFGRDRFHFTRAGCSNFRDTGMIDLTAELRLELALKFLWGLIPIRYSEESIVCTVLRYKAGPVRFIRRGDFYLKLGLGMRGSEAAVYQLCYPQVVKVPVTMHLPVRFKLLFSDAYLEMTPVLRHGTEGFSFAVPSAGYSQRVDGTQRIDTVLRLIPDKGYLLNNGSSGFGWLMQMNADPALLDGSGYVFRRPSHRQGVAECGFRLTVRDLPKGYHSIVNWVIFSQHSSAPAETDPRSFLVPSTVSVCSREFPNLLFAGPQP